MMNMSMSKTSSNRDSESLQYSDLPPVLLITGMEWRPSKKEILQWSTSYPDTDLPGELRRIEEWFQKHPDRRKTERGMHAFIKAWLDRKMHGAAVSQHSQHGTKRGRYHNAFNDFSLRQEYDFEELEADLLSLSGGTDTNES